MTKVYLLIESTWSDGYDHNTKVVGVFSSKALAEYKKPEDIRNGDGYNQVFNIDEMELQTSDTLIEKLKSDLENLEAPVQDECPHRGGIYQDETSDGILHTFCNDCHNIIGDIHQ